MFRISRSLIIVITSLLLPVVGKAMDLTPARLGVPLEGVGGLQGDPPPQSEMSNQVANAGFEEGSSGWLLGTCFSIDNSVAHSGARSLRLDLAGSCGNTRQLNIRTGLKNFRLRAWVKTRAVSGVKPRIGMFDLTHRTTVLTSINGPDGTADWTPVSLDIATTAGHIDDKLELRINHSGQGLTQGTVWFDDIEIVPTYPALSLFVKYPNYRGYLWADRVQEINAVVECRPPAGYNRDQVVLKWAIVDAATQALLAETTIPAPPAETPILWDASGLPQGAEVFIRVSLHKTVGGDVLLTFPDYRIVKAPAAFRTGLNNWIDDNNVLHHAGAKRFVWGVYDRMSGSYRPGGIATTSAAYEAIPGFGGLTTLENYRDTRLNTVLYFSPFSGANPGYSTRSQDQINPWVKALRAKGAMHLHIVNAFHSGNKYRPGWGSGLSDEQLWTVIGERITDPGLLGYYTADEPDLAGVPNRGQASRQYRTLRKVNRGALTYEVFFAPAQLWLWRDSADVFGVDPYPLGSGVLPDDYLYGAGIKPVYGRVDLWTKEAVDAVMGSRPVWMVLQLWTQAGMFPTYEDMRRMAWKAVASGAQGILWWGFVSANGMESRWFGGYKAPCLPQPCDPNAYNDFRRISAEVMDIETVLVEPDALGLIMCSDPRVALRVKRSQGKVWLFASNTSDVTLPYVNFSSSVAISGGVTAYSESRNIQPAGESWSDSFDRQEVHVYSFSSP